MEEKRILSRNNIRHYIFRIDFVKLEENQLNIIKSQQEKYHFDGIQLLIYSSDFNSKISILSIDGKHYFVKKNNLFFYLKLTKMDANFEQVKDENIVEQLEKISFENE
mgnify:CR=1 FL=1